MCIDAWSKSERLLVRLCNFASGSEAPREQTSAMFVVSTLLGDCPATENSTSQRKQRQIKCHSRVAEIACTLSCMALDTQQSRQSERFRRFACASGLNRLQLFPVVAAWRGDGVPDMQPALRRSADMEALELGLHVKRRERKGRGFQGGII